MRLILAPAISVFFFASVPQGNGQSAAAPIAVSAQWGHITRVSVTVPTTQHLANAFTLRSSPLNKQLLTDLRELHTNYTRLQLWFSVPNQVVAELKQPTASQTFWNFQYMDPVVEDYFANTSGLHHVNIGTIPRWMFKVPDEDIPTDPAASYYPYTKGTSGDLLKDPTGRQFAEYQARLYSWYTKGGFTDEIGKFHKSEHHYKIDFWGVLNEPSFENHLTVEQYTKVYDQVVLAIRKIDPKAQFFGPEILGPTADWARYFLNPKNHDPAVLPIQWFSFHNYTGAPNDPHAWQAAYFTNPTRGSAKAFANLLAQIVQIRDQLSPQTKIAVDELGTFDMLKPGARGAAVDDPYGAYNPLYWVATGANWADDFIAAENMGVPVISMTQMVGAPTQSESCSMINWDTASPNAHYWVLYLINRNFGPGDKLVATTSSSPDVVAQASITSRGRRLLLINTSDHAVQISFSGLFAAGPLKAHLVDEASGENPPRVESPLGESISLDPFAVAVVSDSGL